MALVVVVILSYCLLCLWLLWLISCASLYFFLYIMCFCVYFCSCHYVLSYFDTFLETILLFCLQALPVFSLWVFSNCCPEFKNSNILLANVRILLSQNDLLIQMLRWGYWQRLKREIIVNLLKQISSQPYTQWQQLSAFRHLHLGMVVELVQLFHTWTISQGVPTCRNMQLSHYWFNVR